MRLGALLVAVLVLSSLAGIALGMRPVTARAGVTTAAVDAAAAVSAPALPKHTAGGWTALLVGCVALTLARRLWRGA